MNITGARLGGARFGAMGIIAAFVAGILLIELAPACAADAAATARVHLPDAAAQADAAKKINLLFASEIAAAKTASDRTKLARKLLQTASDTAGDPASQYALLQRATEVFVTGGDVDGAFEAAGGISDAFEVDPLKIKLDTANALTKSLRDPTARLALATAIDPLIDSALAADRADMAEQLARLAVAAARASGDLDAGKRAAGRLQRVKELQSVSGEAAHASATLAKSPADLDARLKVGRYRAFVKGDWAGGLPLVAGGSDSRLHDIATMDLAAPTDALAQVAVGDAWWDMAQKENGLYHAPFLARAVYWYGLAEPKLEGLQKVRLTRRIQTAGETAAGPAPATRVFSVASAQDWTTTTASVEQGKCYELQAQGTWTGSAGKPSGPDGLCSTADFALLGPQPHTKAADREQSFVGQHPRNGLICRIGTETWSFYVGGDRRFLAPISGTLSFKISDQDVPSPARSGRMAIAMKEIHPQWVGSSGSVEILARIDAADKLHLTPKGIFWEYGGSWGKVGLHDGYFPTVVNGIFWWPKWADNSHTELLEVAELWPRNPAALAVVKQEAKRGDVKILRGSPQEIVLQFADYGGGSSQVGCVLGAR